MDTWSLQDAKNRFSALVNAAIAGGPQCVTRRGEPVVVVLALDEYEHLLNGEEVPTFVEHLLNIPRGGPPDFEFERILIEPRDVDLGVPD